MRLQQNRQLTLADEFEGWFPVKTFTTDKELARISDVLERIPQALELVAADLKQGEASTNMGRPGVTAEQVLRCAILQRYKGYSCRELAERIDDSIDFRRFTRFYLTEIPHFSALERLIRRIKPETFERINELLLEHAQTVKGQNGRSIEDGKFLRLDCTVAETNIAYPLDARLLNDSVRVLTRILVFCRNNLGINDFTFANRTRRAKRRAYQIVLLKGPQAQKKRRQLYRELLQVTEEVIAMAEEALLAARKAAEQYPDHGDIAGVVSGLKHFLPLAKQAVKQCRRRTQKGEKVPASEKIVSIFEEHTDIICRGKSASPNEFGHKLLFATGKSGLILNYEVFQGNLSTLLRKFGLKRCLWKGWEAFCSYVGVAVLAYNLWKIALLAA